VSDERLRELERRWKETGAVEDGAAWLRERVRVGDLTQERLELAAHCGHQAATTLTRGNPEALSLQEWLGTFPDGGDGAVTRLKIGLARAALPIWEASQPNDHRPHAAIRAAEGWVLCPCADHLAIGEGAAQACEPEATLSPDVVRSVARLAATAARCEGALATTKVEVQKICNPWDTPSDHLVDRCLEIPAELEFRRVACQDLLPWALAVGQDPVALRLGGHEGNHRVEGG
jgi:hypothetical protein